MILNRFYNIWSKGSRTGTPDKLVPIKYDIETHDDGQDYVKIISDHLPTPNISSHTFVDIMGMNQYTSPAKAIMKLFHMIKEDPFNIYYTIRGGIVETLALEYVKKLYPGCTAKGYDLQDFPNFNQFPEAKPFSGVVDIGITEPFRMSVEVKSKDYKYLNAITRYGNYPKEEVHQGEFLGELFGADKYMMLWGIITPWLEGQIQGIVKDEAKLKSYAIKVNGRDTFDYGRILSDLKLALGTTHIKWHHQTYTVRHDVIRKEMKDALDLRNKIISYKAIPVNLFSKEDFEDFVKEAFDYKN